jgi:N-methylhydantoinase B
MPVETMEEIVWDGKTHSYMPPDELTIHESVPIYEKVDAKVDPVTHEVLRHALWNVNVEHGNTLMRISGSPICAYGHDFNPAILDAEGNFIFFGPFLQYLAANISSSVKWILENRSENPGIRPGDMFLFNDPWIGCSHQSDAGVVAPVFVDGKLFAWVGATLHQWDMGGTVPGGFNPMADDHFWESPLIPPTRIVEDGVIRRDIEEHYTRMSRLPQLVGLDLRAQVTGCRAATNRMNELAERYGGDTLKGTMQKLQDDSEVAFVKRLETIPDGTWTEEGWLEVDRPGDRGVYRNRITVTKRGDHLTFSNAGSADQTGTISGAFGGWKGAVVSMLNSMFLFDQMFCLEGALRHCSFEAEPGKINCASRPAAVSGATAMVLPQSIGLSGLVLSKMVACSSDEDLRSEAQSCMGCMVYPVNGLSGLDQRGAPYSTVLLDALGAALAAHPWRDGQDTGGWPWDLQSTMPNVEDQELFYPLLYLWRKELPDSGGAGRFRGGNSAEVAFVPHKTEKIDAVTVAGQVAVPGPGLFGGYPTSTNRFEQVKGAKVADQVGSTGAMPTELAHISRGERGMVQPKSFGHEVTPDDLWVYAWASAGGYGDPIDRDPESTRADVAAGRVTAAWAEEAYGVVISGEGEAATVDAAATEARRNEIRSERLADAKPVEGGEEPADAPMPADGRLNDDMRIENGEIFCGEQSLGPANRNYKLGALTREIPISAANPNIGDPAEFVDHSVRLRQIIAPDTGQLLQTEIVIDDAAPEWDLRPGQ